MPCSVGLWVFCAVFGSLAKSMGPFLSMAKLTSIFFYKILEGTPGVSISEQSGVVFVLMEALTLYLSKE